MDGAIRRNLEALGRFAEVKGWRVSVHKEIDHGYQVIITDGAVGLPVNLYSTGKIVIQGKPCEMKQVLTEWANVAQAALVPGANDVRRNRVARYLVPLDALETIHRVVLSMPGDITEKQTTGPGEVYRYEVRQGIDRVTITQYSSGTLMVQGVSSPGFDAVCEVLDRHLAQSFCEHAIRLVEGDEERSVAATYLDTPEAEKEAVTWLLEQIGESVLGFLYEQDRRTLLAAAGVRNAFRKARQHLPDYSVVVMPFAKPFEGFVIRLAIHLKLATEEVLGGRVDEIQIGRWLEAIGAKYSGGKRYTDAAALLQAAWERRNRALNSGTGVYSLEEADWEISMILGTMVRAYQAFVEECVTVATSDCTPVPPKKRSNQSQVRHDDCLAGDRRVLIAKGEGATEFDANYGLTPTGRSGDSELVLSMSRIGVDESGKGDVFGPLVIAGVVLTPDAEGVLARQGVRDSKSLSDARVLDLARVIQSRCLVGVLLLRPSEYNKAYEENGRNLNRLLAWGHAQLISRLEQWAPVGKAISDQFGDEALLVEALQASGSRIVLEQRPRAESDLAVAAASVVARARFLGWIHRCAKDLGLDIPLGASAAQVRDVARLVYRRWGRRGLERLTKIHFATVQDIISEGVK